MAGNKSKPKVLTNLKRECVWVKLNMVNVRVLSTKYVII